MNIQRPNRPHKISPGHYEETFEISLPPTLPCFNSSDHARVSYIITARLIRKWSLDVIETKEIWFVSTILPPPSAGLQLVPATTYGHWKEVLPCSITLPSEVLCLGQTVPVIIRLGPFLSTSKASGKRIKFCSRDFD
ncbi:hypothetical protein BC939DRAFT_220168 [Gamsiella multidivaricata]|uniref:uncharacterized protein n=1 Tax=Gamsiella multidivaricata TaxID=101098 RepID=UPI00221E7CB6|nr:uncharacterized protein BC939DRAFT_220168 [Gamsiella multidivaricata]KAI7831118.1 hypothetical protein BC939DRAFT_220168 [Gamsiella multidivaricata]